MRQNVDSHSYKTMDDFEKDFETIIKNCCTYNAKDTVFYRSAVKLRDQVVQAKSIRFLVNHQL